MNRHRFVSVVGGGEGGARLCGWVFPGGAVRCALPYPSEWHYNDADHPYVSSGDDCSPARGCHWQMQSAPIVGLCGKEQYVMEHQTDHNSGELPIVGKGNAEQTVRLDLGAEVREQHGRMYGTPADAAVGVEASELSEPDPLVVSPGVDPAAQAAAGALEGGQVVDSGPWPVRQFLWGSGQLGVALGQVTEALAVSGEPFMLETWWADARVQMVRVQWGVLLLETGADLLSSVRSWRV